MTKYIVYFTKALSTSVDVEAEDADEASDKAYDKLRESGPPGLCAYCTGWGRPWKQDDAGDWELDGEPEVSGL